MSFTDLTIEEYTDRSVVVQGNTRKYKEDLKKLGGKYNGRLKNGPGWIFPKTSEDGIKTFINNGKRLVTAEEAKEGEERSKKRADEWAKQKETPVCKKISRSSGHGLGSISNMTPTLTEYSDLMIKVKDMCIKIDILILLLSDEQKQMLNVLMNQKENKSVVKKVVKRKQKKVDTVLDESVSESESESDDVVVPRKRLLR
jgi:hypothetical protein